MVVYDHAAKHMERELLTVLRSMKPVWIFTAGMPASSSMTRGVRSGWRKLK
jgi:hypothetical protein